MYPLELRHLAWALEQIDKLFDHLDASADRRTDVALSALKGAQTIDRSPNSAFVGSASFAQGGLIHALGFHLLRAPPVGRPSR